MNLVQPREHYSPGPDEDGPAFAWMPALLAFLRRNYRRIASWTVLAVLLGLGYLATATPKYTASVQLLIDTRSASSLLQGAATPTPDAAVQNADIESQVEVLRSFGLARDVAQQLGLEVAPPGGGISLSGLVARAAHLIQRDTRAPEPGDPVDRAADAVSRLVNVRRIGLSNVIEIDVTTPDAAGAAKIANALVSAYVAASLRAKYDVTRQAGAWLQDRLQELRSQSVSADNAVEALRARAGIVSTDKGGLNEQQLGDLSLQIAAARAHVSDAAARYARIQAVTSGEAAAGSVSDALQNGVVQKLQQQVLDTARRLAEWTQRYGPNHVAVIQLRTELAGLQAAIGSELTRIQEATKSDLAVAQTNEAAIQRQIDGLVAVATTTNNQRAQVRALESLADTYRSLYGAFLARYSQAAQDQSFPVSDARVITAATPPLYPSRPQTLLVLLGSLVAGLGAGVMAAAFAELVDRRIRNAEQVTGLTGLDVLAQLPRAAHRAALLQSATSGQILPSHPAMLRSAVAQPFSPFAQAVRGLSLRITRPVQVLGIASSGAGEGCTVVAANLAQLMAADGKRVVLVDAGQRPSGLTRAWAPGCSAGWQDVAAGRAVLGDVMWRDAQTGLAFLPAGSGPAPAAALDGLLPMLHGAFDTVVLDLPPLGVLGARAALLDAMLLVVAWGRTPEAALVDALAAADLDAAVLLGVVMNQVDRTAMRRWGGGGGTRYRAFASGLSAA